MIKCKYANRKQGLSKPVCNGGEGCDYCNEQFKAGQASHAAAHGVAHQDGRRGRILPKSGLFVADDPEALYEALFEDLAVIAAVEAVESITESFFSGNSNPIADTFGGGGDFGGGGSVVNGDIVDHRMGRFTQIKIVKKDLDIV